jgi:hypothetical protein
MGESLSSPASSNFKTSTPRRHSSAHSQKGKQNMADYFTNFSLIVPLPTEEAVEYAIQLAEHASGIQLGNEMAADFPESLRDVTDDWLFETDANDASEGRGLWLHSINGGIDAVCAFIQHLLQRFTPDHHVTLEWSNDCSKPRVDAFGGGAALITARKIKSISTSEWLHRQVSRLRKPRRKPSAKERTAA